MLGTARPTRSLGPGSECPNRPGDGHLPLRALQFVDGAAHLWIQDPLVLTTWPFASSMNFCRQAIHRLDGTLPDSEHSWRGWNGEGLARTPAGSSCSSSERFSNRFKGEARAISALNHPHIRTLYDVGSLRPAYLVTDLVERKTLQDWLKDSSVVERRIEIAQQVLQALRAAHMPTSFTAQLLHSLLENSLPPLDLVGTA